MMGRQRVRFTEGITLCMLQFASRGDDGNSYPGCWRAGFRSLRCRCERSGNGVRSAAIWWRGGGACYIPVFRPLKVDLWHVAREGKAGRKAGEIALTQMEGGDEGQ